MLKAGEKIENDPRCLKLPGVDMTDDLILHIFKIDYQPAAAVATELEERNLNRMDRLMELILAVLDAQATCTGFR